MQKLDELRVGLPKNLYVRAVKYSSPCYYWVRPQLEPKYRTFGGDRELAIREAKRMHEEAGQAHDMRGRMRGRHGMLRDRAAFDALDAKSRERALTEHESNRLYDLMVLLGMVEPEGDE